MSRDPRTSDPCGTSGGLVVGEDIKVGAAHMHPCRVAKFAELIHEETYTGVRSADHLGERGGHELSKTQCILNVTPQTYEPTACRCGFEVEFGWSRSSGGPIRERFWCETHHTEITDEYSDA